MLKIAICDDSEYMRTETEKILLKYSVQKDIDLKMYQYERGEDLLEHIEEFSIVFLDYEFENKGINGIEIAREIRRKVDVTIIFLSSYSSIVFDVFEVSAFRFLLKPVEEEKVFKAMDDYLKSVNEEMLVIKTEGVRHYIKEKNIMYVEADGKNCLIHIYNKKPKVVKCRDTLALVEERLSKNHFYRCHKSFLVNMRFIESFSRTDLRLQNDEIIMISRQKYRPFCNAYSKYISQYAN